MALKWLFFFTAAVYLCGVQGETGCPQSENVSCTECFTRGTTNFTEIRLFPSLTFTCNGTIVGWTVSGRVGQGTKPPKLQVWSRSSSDAEQYYKHGREIPLHNESLACKVVTEICPQTFQCILKEGYQVAVQSGDLDIIGVELPPPEDQSFELFFKAGSENQSVWLQESSESNDTVRIGSEDLVVTEDVLLILNVSTDASECAADCNCTDTTGSIECSCLEGDTASGDEQCCVAVDIDECSTGTHTCEQICIDSNTTVSGGYTCDCHSGYVLNSDNRTCSDVNECASNSGGCEHGLCTNSEGSFECGCRDGYELGSDGRSCNDTNECIENRDSCEHVCTNTEGTFQCSCLDGYILDSDGANCTDVDECSLGEDNCQQLCLNSDGGFTCECDTGYRLDTDGANCSDTDECIENRDSCEHICTNTEGTFQCSCLDGYILDSDGTNCTDVDECSLGEDNCQQLCLNSDGGFTCECDPGYRLNYDGANCSDINECDNKSSGCHHICSNSEGTFSCSCRLGYSLDENGQSCTDIDECADENGGCPHICFNTNGSFSCTCREGFLLSDNGLSCDEITKRGSMTGAAVGGTFVGIVIVVIVVLLMITIYVIYLRRMKRGNLKMSPPGRRQLQHEISLPYLVENKGYCSAVGSPRGPQILVLNAPAPADEDRTNLEIYNSLFDEEGTIFSNYDNGTPPN